MIVQFSTLARDDLESVRAWIARDNPLRANSYVDELIGACENLAVFPLRFPLSRFRSRRPIRQRAYDNYLILFEVTVDYVEIVGIVHGARDLDALLR